jgi:hypothetical protein
VAREQDGWPAPKVTGTPPLDSRPIRLRLGPCVQGASRWRYRLTGVASLAQRLRAHAGARRGRAGQRRFERPGVARVHGGPDVGARRECQMVPPGRRGVVASPALQPAPGKRHTRPLHVLLRSEAAPNAPCNLGVHHVERVGGVNLNRRSRRFVAGETVPGGLAVESGVHLAPGPVRAGRERQEQEDRKASHRVDTTTAPVLGPAHVRVRGAARSTSGLLWWGLPSAEPNGARPAAPVSLTAGSPWQSSGRVMEREGRGSTASRDTRRSVRSIAVPASAGRRPSCDHRSLRMAQQIRVVV